MVDLSASIFIFLLYPSTNETLHFGVIECEINSTIYLFLILKIL
jgi:hypothetical protein